MRQPPNCSCPSSYEDQFNVSDPNTYECGQCASPLCSSCATNNISICYSCNGQYRNPLDNCNCLNASFYDPGVYYTTSANCIPCASVNCNHCSRPPFLQCLACIGNFRNISSNCACQLGYMENSSGFGDCVPGCQQNCL
jgi:hypothetical protein